jgi:hypothetical protein
MPSPISDPGLFRAIFRLNGNFLCGVGFFVCLTSRVVAAVIMVVIVMMVVMVVAWAGWMGYGEWWA